jgi:hypothetical protein
MKLVDSAECLLSFLDGKWPAFCFLRSLPLFLFSSYPQSRCLSAGWIVGEETVYHTASGWANYGGRTSRKRLSTYRSHRFHVKEENKGRGRGHGEWLGERWFN